MSNSGNPEIQEYIEYGTGAVKEFIFEVKGKKGSIKWSPITFPLAKIAFYKALLHVDDEYRDFLATTRAKRKEKKMTRPPVEVILTFNFYHSTQSIFFAIRNHYDGVTQSQVESLPLPDFDAFHTEIATASGIMDGQETVASFPANK